MTAHRRIAAVTAWLTVAGGVFGTIAGLVVLITWGMFDGGSFHFTRNYLSLLLQISTVFGGGPIAAWLLMRHVPLGLAVGGTTLGTLAGGGIALVATGDPVIAMLYGMGASPSPPSAYCCACPRESAGCSGAEGRAACAAAPLG